jgi:uncharacterized protein
MKINNEFTVGVPIQEAWGIMLDLERVAPCLPGAAIQESTGDGEYQGTMKVKIGPITANYKGTVKVEEADSENRRAVMKATGRDARGQGTASATIVSTLRQESDDRTRVEVETDMRLTGRAAQFGRGIAQDVATKMLGQFAECLEREISGEPAAEAAPSAPPEGDGAASRDESSAATVGGIGGTAGRIISSEDPSVVASGPVEGAVVSEGAPSGAPEAAASAESPPQQERQAPPSEPEAFDLGAASQEAVLKRVAPVLAGLGLLAILIWLIRR